MFELAAPTRLKVKNASPRKEVHGEELVQAIDVDLEWTTSNESLGLLDGSLLRALYERDESQRDIEGIAAVATSLRFAFLDMPLKWALELEGRDFRIDHGLGGKSDLVLATSRVKKFRLTCKEGGTVVVGFQVQCNTGVSEKVVGKLCALEGSDIEATLKASDEAPAETGLAFNAALESAEGAVDEQPTGDPGADGPWPFGDQGANNRPAVAARAAPGKPARAVAYRYPLTGETWSGRGLKPAWLKLALDSGRTLDEFAVKPPATAPQPKPRRAKKPDPTQAFLDAHAGSTP